MKKWLFKKYIQQLGLLDVIFVNSPTFWINEDKDVDINGSRSIVIQDFMYIKLSDLKSMIKKEFNSGKDVLFVLEYSLKWSNLNIFSKKRKLIRLTII